MKRPPCGPAFWHVFARGSRRLALFYEDQDFREFLMFLREALIVSGCTLYGYCLMDNHYHLILRGDQTQLTLCMWRVNWRYALYHNGRYRGRGHVFDGPYHAFRQRTLRYMLWKLAYVFLNPVVSGKVLQPGDYAWSGYHSALGLPGSPMEVTPVSSLSGGIENLDTDAAFRRMLKEQQSQPARKAEGTPTAREIALHQFQWLRREAGLRAAELVGVEASTLACYWGHQAGVPPRVMATSLEGMDARMVSDRIRRFDQRLQQDPELARRAGAP